MAPSNSNICVWVNFISDILGLALCEKPESRLSKWSPQEACWVLTQPCKYLETLTSLQMIYSQVLFQSIMTSFWT